MNRAFRALGFLLAWISLGGCTTAWFSAYRSEQERKEALRPKYVEAPVARTYAPPRLVRTKALVTPGFQHHYVNWKREVGRQFAAASRLLADLNVRFELVEVQPWAHEGGRALEGDLEVLRQQYPSDDFDFVVGFVGALPLFTNAHHRLGIAFVPGRHAIVRAIDDHHELEAFKRGLTMTGEAEIQELYRQRLQHKRAVVLVHEWAHGMGATHVPGGADWFMRPDYEPHVTGFTPDNYHVIKIGLEYRLGANRDDALWASEVAKQLEVSQDSNADIAALLQFLRAGSPGGGRLPGGRSAAPWTGISQAHRKALNASIRLRNAGDSFAAWETIEPLREEYREDSDMQVYSCDLAVQISLPEADDVCEVARVVARTDPRPAVRLFELRAKQDGRRDLLLLKEGCERLPLSQSLRDSWLHSFAELAASWGLSSCAQDARAKLTDPELSKRTQRTVDEWARIRGTAPVREGSLTLDEEIKIREATVAIVDDMKRGRLKTAEAKARGAIEKFGTSGLHALRCELYGRRKQYAAARRSCTEALKLQPDNARAMFLMAVLEIRTGQSKKAERWLVDAVTHAPLRSAAWGVLEDYYRGQNRQAAYRELRTKLRGSD